MPDVCTKKNSSTLQNYLSQDSWRGDAAAKFKIPGKEGETKKGISERLLMRHLQLHCCHISGKQREHWSGEWHKVRILELSFPLLKTIFLKKLGLHWTILNRARGIRS
ncbi:Hypothetical predicted protein [Podarcis lilfordi]|uniref:Uncharacterized protein n=1 Tax=Podarcis lilfordi TaxID=74358 RepID=A0AA35KB69_9SAUR|nr:Hypothetical predicted protein [Podarcis lilfordi]